MNDEKFWALIEQSRKGAASCEDQADALTTRLAQLEPSEITAFDDLFSGFRAQAYRWDLWAVAYIVNGGCSDDGFEYFRCWLIGQGKSYYEQAMQSPESAADRVTPGDEVECEDLLYAASIAYERKTGHTLPASSYAASSPEPIGEPWDEDAVEALYPELYERFA